MYCVFTVCTVCTVCTMYTGILTFSPFLTDRVVSMYLGMSLRDHSIPRLVKQYINNYVQGSELYKYD